MDKVKVRSVPHGQIYRPVFDAEEQLIQSFKSRKISKLPGLENVADEGRPTGSGDYFDITSSKSSDRYEFEKDISVDELQVKNLPDRLPPLGTGAKPSEKLAKLHQKRSERHVELVHNFEEEFKNEISLYNTKISDLISALKVKLDLNHVDTNLAICNFDNEDILEETTEETLDIVWNHCKAMAQDNLISIERFREGYFNLQQLQTKRITVVLQHTLKSLLKNSFLPKTENYRLIETESMLLNQTNLTNSRHIYKQILSLIENESHHSMQTRIAFNERKTQWNQFRINRRIRNFTDLLEAEDTIKPTKIKDALENLRISQKDFVDKRNDLIVTLAELNPEEQNLLTFERWVQKVESLRDDIDENIEETLADCKEIFVQVSNMIFEEEKRLHDDLYNMVDITEIEGLMEPVQDQVNAVIDMHYMDLRELRGVCQIFTTELN
jgi:gas vesicle protein